MTNTNSFPLFSDDELDSNVPSSPDTFRPRDNGKFPLRTTSLITRKWCKANRKFSAAQNKPSTWTFGITADGQIIGERWSKRDINGKWRACVIDEMIFATKSLLKQELLAWKRLHWKLEQFTPARVIPSRWDK